MQAARAAWLDRRAVKADLRLEWRVQGMVRRFLQEDSEAAITSVIRSFLIRLDQTEVGR